MDKMADVLGRAGAWCGQNKYLSAIKNAFQSFMPLTIAGAIGVLWCNVLVHAENGLGALWSPIMALDFLNPAFSAIQYATISCITVGVTFGIAQEIGIWNLGKEKAGYFPGILGLACWIAVTQTSHGNYALVEGVDAAAKVVLNENKVMTTFSGLSGEALGATGLFTGMFVGIISIEVFCWLSKREGLKIKMPETVPPGVARAFEVLIPAFLTITVISLIGLLCHEVTGLYLNDVIKTSIQEPLQGVGASIPGVIVIYLLIMLFWLVGIHGNNMLSAVKEAIFTPMLVENMNAYNKGLRGDDIPNVWNMPMLQMYGEFGGSGCTIGLLVAIMIFSRREDNKAVGTLSLVPGLFNINETVTFGIPMVLNPILGIPFVLTPIITLLIGYFGTTMGIFPKVVVTAPWTTPPIVFGFIATGANIMGAVAQLIVMVVSVVIYAPFLIAYERQQNKEAA